MEFFYVTTDDPSDQKFQLSKISNEFLQELHDHGYKFISYDFHSINIIIIQCIKDGSLRNLLVPTSMTRCIPYLKNVKKVQSLTAIEECFPKIFETLKFKNKISNDPTFFNWIDGSDVIFMETSIPIKKFIESHKYVDFEKKKAFCKKVFTDLHNLTMKLYKNGYMYTHVTPDNIGYIEISKVSDILPTGKMVYRDPGYLGDKHPNEYFNRIEILRGIDSSFVMSYICNPCTNNTKFCSPGIATNESESEELYAYVAQLVKEELSD